ncbi:MAG: hypothetical protein AAFQ06_01405 [Pseudomonadota bacterium]
MYRSAKKSLTAIALCCGMALSAVTVPAAPARAGDAEDIVGILAGLAALYAIGRAIEDRNDRQTHRPQVTRNPPPQNLRVAPAACFREFQANNGRVVRGYGARCMQNRVARPGILPPECIRNVQTNRGGRFVYGGRCLAQNGWRREAGFRP